LFFLFYKIVQIGKTNFNLLAYVAFIFRAVFILAIPNLSQDFYRFIWDGQMLLLGLNPYLSTPAFEINQGMISGFHNQIELYQGMGVLNASHYSNYPPLNQILFVFGNLFPGNSILSSVIGLRLIIIAADFGILYFGKKLLERLNIPIHNIFWYILNPFIIIELTGNLHFEGVMVFFLIWSLYLLHKGKWQWSAVVFALSVSVKLIPLIFLPLLYQWFASKRPLDRARGDINNVDTIEQKRDSFLTRILRLFGYYVIVGVTTIILFLPFYSSQFVTNYAETVALWFQNFEFNASFYYIAREIGYSFRGYNEIAYIGKYTAFIVFIFVIIISLFRKNKTTTELITAMLIALSFYYFTATTVHPWYVATLLLLSVFTKYKFPLVWSLVIILSYLAYLNINKADKSENLWIIALEYLIVYGVFIWEIIINPKKLRTTAA
jgi:hypothetical protein